MRCANDPRETSRQALENELQSIKSSSSTSNTEIDGLKARIVSLETSNRETLSIIETKNKANESLSQELQAQHQKSLKLSQEVASLQQTIQSTQAAAASAKFKEQSVQQQLEMAQRSAEFYENELQTKQAEALKFRKERGARIAELQRLNEETTANLEAKTRTEQQLRKQVTQAQAKTQDTLLTLQKEREAFARKEQGYREDLDSTNRLLSMKDEQLQSQKKRMLDVESRMEQVKKDGEDAVRRISEELAQATEGHDQATAEVQSLQAEIARLKDEAQDAGSPGQLGSAPQTPRPMNGSVFGRPSSPFGTPASARKSYNSASQAIAENASLRNQLSTVRFENQKLREEMDDMVSQLEAKIPEMQELHSENERLQREIQNMSHLSDESFKERDLAKKAAKKAEVALSNSQVEANILRNQVRDLSAQMQMMIFNLEHRDQELTLEETLQLQRISRADGFATDDMSDVDTLVTERLVVFRDIKDLQEKNQELLRVIHQLSEDMKNEDDAAAKQQAIEDRNENARLRDQIKEFQDRLKAFSSRTEIIMKERDMFRRLADGKKHGEGASSVDDDSHVLASIEENSAAGDGIPDYAALLRDLQASTEAYRAEMAVDRDTLKTQVRTLSSEKNALQAENSKIQSQLSLASERYEMLQGNFAALQTENSELQKRVQTLSESAARQDLVTQQAAEELVEVRSQADSLRSENSNLRAEKNLWKDIQERLSKDNEALTAERSRLNGLLATQETLKNERDLNEAEAKRRMQAELEAAQTELSALKRKLAEEQEGYKMLQQRKEYDAQTAQKRIDELSATLSELREELVATKTTKDHLQARNDELTIQLNSANERAERLQPRPTPRPGTAVPGSDQTGSQDADERVQELIHEVSDLKRDLDLTKMQLENAQGQIGQYKELSEAVEEDLRNITSSQDEYAEKMDAELAAKDSTIKELQQRTEDLSAELARSNSELSTLRDGQADVARRFQDEKAILEEELQRLKDQESNYAEAARFHQEDLRQQADIARSAQESYEKEVSKHGETATSLSNVRKQYNELRTETATLRAEAESARATLLQNESSWEDRRKKMEHEMAELRARRDDADAQNKLLHQQLESVTSQVGALQQIRTSGGPNEDMELIEAQPSSSSEAQLRELASYLRREKDILEVQYDLKLRESKRLQEQLNYTQSQLDESRLKLEQERQSQSDSQQNSMSHKDLMQKLEELNLFRESSAALRHEVKQAQASLSEKTAKIMELEAKVQPLEATIEELNSQQSFKEVEIKQLQEDRDRWQKRTEDILTKHGQTDPAEVDELRETIARLEAEKKALQEAEAPLREKIEALEKVVEENEANLKDRLEKQKTNFTAQFKTRFGQAKQEKDTAVQERDAAVAERDNLQSQLEAVNGQLTTVKEELDTEKKERLAATEQIKHFQAQVQTLQEEARQAKNMAPAAPTAPTPAPAPTEATPPGPDAADGDAASSQQISDLEKQLADARTELENVSSQKANVEQELQQVRGQLELAISERDAALASAQAGTTNSDVPMENGAAAPAPLTDEERKALEEKIAAAESRAAELEAKANELEVNQANIVKERCDKMKAILNKKMADKNQQMEQERAEHKEATEKMQEELKLRLEQERKIWEAEQGSTTAADVKPPATPSQPAAPATPASGAPGGAADLLNLTDAEARDFVNKNATVKAILSNNIKSKIAQETKRLKEECEQNHIAKSEVEQKVAQAREQAQKLAASKATLQLNMAENKARHAAAKLGVVETAAKDTPQRPVVEVWAIAKEAKAPPPPPKPAAQPAAPAGAAGTCQSPALHRPTVTYAKYSPALPTHPAANGLPRPAAGSALPKPPGAAAPTSLPANPFGASQGPGAQPPTANPFASSTNGNAAPASAPTPASASTSSQPQPAQAGATGPAKSGIPPPSSLPKSNLRQPGTTTYQAPRGGARGGRGGARGGAQTRQSLNAGAENFQPGNKRPRGESDVGAGAKRQRGGGPAQ